jgi:hypothetical protein
MTLARRGMWTAVVVLGVLTAVPRGVAAQVLHTEAAKGSGVHAAPLATQAFIHNIRIRLARRLHAHVSIATCFVRDVDRNTDDDGADTGVGETVVSARARGPSPGPSRFHAFSSAEFRSSDHVIEPRVPRGPPLLLSF